MNGLPINKRSKNRLNRYGLSPLSYAIAVISISASPFFFENAVAQEVDETVEIEEVVTIGTRAKARSVTDSPAPVDVFGENDLMKQGGSNMTDLIRNLVPSYNVNDQPISDAATLVRPANLRGLAPDHTLLLVNGKRRHRAAVISWLGNGISNGSQGPDMAAIPAAAIKSVEVLRDGAAAQYGSDAIAGVINFQLKDDSEGGSLQVRTGQYSEGDGTEVTVAGNLGLPLGSEGFANLTLEYSQIDATDRSIQRADAADLIAAGYDDVPVNAMVWGQPEVNDDIKLFANVGLPINEAMELYGYANLNSKKVTGGFYYRNPINRGGVYGISEGDDLFMLAGDLTPNDGVVDCPTQADLAYDLDPTSARYLEVANQAALDQVFSNPNCFAFREIIPGGFTPQFGGDLSDRAIQTGIRSRDGGDLSWDVSAYYGENIADFFILNTLNASLGPDSPRDFNPGAYEQRDWSINADFVYALNDQIGFAFGAEYREEEFALIAGDEASYSNGILASQGFSTSSNGFPGFAPAIAGSWSRSNYALYWDTEYDATDDLLLTAALRFEDFDDFGTTTNYKLGGNYRISDTVGVRSTYSTGFKAPTPGQSNASNVTTQFVSGVLTNQGTIPSTNPVAQAVGGRQLTPEKSTNLTLGVYFTMGAFDFTVDYFDIDVEDRLNQSRDFTLTAEQRANLIASGVSGVDDIADFRFFTNDFDTNTSGFDVVVSTDTDWLGGTTDWSLAYNYTKTDVTQANPDTVDAIRIRRIEESVPDTRWNLSANHQWQQLQWLTRLSYYGDFFDSEASNTVFDAAWTLDTELSYALNEQVQLIAGGRNITNEKGCEVDDCSNGRHLATDVGYRYSQFSPFGFNGAFWYARVQYDF